MTDGLNSDNPSLERVAADAEGARTAARHAIDRVDELEEQLGELEAVVEAQKETIENQQDTIEELDDRTSLIHQIQRNDTPEPAERAAILVQNLVNLAHNNPNRDRAEMDVNRALTALGGSVRRELVYPTFEKAVDLVDDEETLRYITEKRSADKNSRLVLDLESGELPETVAGHAITREGMV